MGRNSSVPLLCVFLLFCTCCKVVVGLSFTQPNANSTWISPSTENYVRFDESISNNIFLYLVRNFGNNSEIIFQKPIQLNPSGKSTNTFSIYLARIEDLENSGASVKLLYCETEVTLSKAEDGSSSLACKGAVYSDSFTVVKRAWKVKMTTSPPFVNLASTEFLFSPEVEVVDEAEKPIPNTKFVVSLSLIDNNTGEKSCKALSGETEKTTTADGKAVFEHLKIEEAIRNATVVAKAYRLVTTEQGETIKEEVDVSGVSKPFEVKPIEAPDAPLRLSVERIESNSAYLRWYDPETPNVARYKILITGRTCCGDWVPREVPFNFRPVKLNCLCPETDYSVNVFTYNSADMRSANPATVTFSTPSFSLENYQPKENEIAVETGLFILIMLLAILHGVIAALFTLCACRCCCKHFVKPMYDFIQYDELPDEDDEDDDDEEELDEVTNIRPESNIRHAAEENPRRSLESTSALPQ